MSSLLLLATEGPYGASIMANNTETGTPRRFISFSSGGNVSNVQGDDLMVLIMVPVSTLFSTISNTSLLLRGVTSVSPDWAAAIEGTRVSRSVAARSSLWVFTVKVLSRQ